MSLNSNNVFVGIKDHIKPYMSLFVYIVLLNASIVMATVIIHESGHYALGYIADCQNMKIILFDASTGGTYTQMNCSPDVNVNILALGGFLFVIPFALFFFLLGRPERYFWLVIMGFNIVISYSDIGMATNLLMLPAIFAFSGIGLLILGETLLIDRSIYITIEKIRTMDDLLIK